MIEEKITDLGPTKGNKHEFKIEIPSIILEEESNKKLLEVQKNYKMNGFRPGKVPLKVIEQKVGSQIFFEQVEALINQNIKKIIEKNKFDILLTPDTQFTNKVEQGKDITLTVTFELMPLIPEINFESANFLRYKILVNNEDQENELKNILEKYKEWKKQDKDYQSELRDTVNIDYVGKIDNKKFEGGEAKNFDLELGSKSFIGNFEEQLLKTKEGDDVIVRVTFPSDFHNEALRGKEANFEVKINSVLKSSIPSFDTEFVKKNLGFKSVEDFKNNLKKELQNASANFSSDRLKEDIVNFLIKELEFYVSESLIEKEIKLRWENLNTKTGNTPKDQNKNYKIEDIPSDIRKHLYESCNKSVKQYLIFTQLFKKYNLSVSEKEIIEKIKTENHKKITERIVNLAKASLTEDKLIQFLISKFKIEEKSVSLTEFRNIDK